ncbi:Sporulation-control protein spo0M [Desulfamplus magnetovallimortis]|uniref:Sporulation-control protein spo0M n=1 Tax=Desulfamplus magnetovallimortis TaxID=1246637 RepID=A0A1W1HIH2_9BACT|nr:sporulation protein [Desulfamplus magnetovallimortis]SLM32215.1 Sporulation-control protein spo0M [Desulfamplus magnetovallimortis]
MSLFKKMLSSVGIGAATVNTELFNESYTPGESLTGIINIKGGSVEQQIDAIYLKIKSTFEDEIEVENEDGEENEINITRNALVAEYKISEPFTIGKNESISFDLDFILPEDTPVTVGKTRTWVETGLDIKMALDPSDKDYIHVLPHPMVDAVLTSTMDMGFEISEVVCEPAPPFMQMRLPFIQEFELKPVEGHFKTRLDEIELVFRPEKDRVEIFMEVDRKARGLLGSLSEMMGTDESMLRFTLHQSDLDTIILKLNDLIEEHC